MSNTLKRGGMDVNSNCELPYPLLKFQKQTGKMKEERKKVGL